MKGVSWAHDRWFVLCGTKSLSSAHHSAKDGVSNMTHETVRYNTNTLAVRGVTQHVVFAGVLGWIEFSFKIMERGVRRGRWNKKAHVGTILVLMVRILMYLTKYFEVAWIHGKTAFDGIRLGFSLYVHCVFYVAVHGHPHFDVGRTVGEADVSSWGLSHWRGSLLQQMLSRCCLATWCTCSSQEISQADVFFCYYIYWLCLRAMLILSRF